MLKKATSFLLLMAGLLMATDITIDASQPASYQLRKIFDPFRAANGPQPGRLNAIHSQMVRMFTPMTGRMYGFGSLFDVVTGTYPNFKYHFDLVDSDWVGPIIAEGSDLILGYCYMPVSLSAKDAFSPPDNYAAWETFNFEWAKHFNSKFGITNFEIWNEPDYSYFFSGSRDDYFKMYKYAVKGIRQAVPKARVGGPALANNIGWVGPFLDYCIQNNLPVNFISYHAQDNGLKDAGSKYITRYLDILAELDSRGMDSIDVICDEFSYKLNPTQGDNYARSEVAAWFAGTFKFILQNMPRLTRFNKTIVDNNGSLLKKWKYNALITENNIPKAKYNVFRMYSMMPDPALVVNTSNTSLDAMASIDKGKAAIMVWNKNSAAVPLNLELKNLPFSVDTAGLYIVDPTHASYFDDPNTAELGLSQTLSNSGSTFSYATEIPGYSVYFFMLDSSVSISNLADKIYTPKQFALKNYPNPFNPATTIQYTLPARSSVKLQIFDIHGQVLRLLVDQLQAAGKHTWHFDGSNLSSGIYFYRLTTAGQSITHKMMLLR